MVFRQSFANSFCLRKSSSYGSIRAATAFNIFHILCHSTILAIKFGFTGLRDSQGIEIIDIADGRFTDKGQHPVSFVRNGTSFISEE